MQQRERLFFFSVSVPSSSKIVPGAQALLYPFFWAGPPPVPAWGSTLREPGLGAVAILKDVEPELPFLKCLCIGDAIGLSRGVAREKLCENESTSCVVDSRDGDCTKYTGCPCLVGDNGGDGTKLDSESNEALIFPYRDILLLRTYTKKERKGKKTSKHNVVVTLYRMLFLLITVASYKSRWDRKFQRSSSLCWCLASRLEANSQMAACCSEE